MQLSKVVLCSCLTVALVGLLQPVKGDSFPVILRGKVEMRDGSPPPKSVGIEKVCTDTNGSAPGPVTNKQGEYLWRLTMDYMATKKCIIRATSSDYVSTGVDISSINGTNPNVTLETLVLTPKMLDPTAIITPEDAVPGKARPAWKAAMAAAEARDLATAEQKFLSVTQDAPKFGPGWHALGIARYFVRNEAGARSAFEQAIAADPKFLSTYGVLARVQLKMKDWDGVARTCEALWAVDKKETLPEAHMHLAVARYEKKDLAGAEAEAKEALAAKNAGKVPRAEYVLGRILLAKGDVAGAREHMAKYLQMDPKAEDKAQIQAFILTLEKPSGPEPELELL